MVVPMVVHRTFVQIKWTHCQIIVLGTRARRVTATIVCIVDESFINFYYEFLIQMWTPNRK